mmetsp:Transcript_7247/g.21577  ORF Transcript_7247/g.21577 Transcript_7247/m.21577 type:complete len:213 (-) Transcript_7247:348-986(-)
MRPDVADLGDGQPITLLLAAPPSIDVHMDAHARPRLNAHVRHAGQKLRHRAQAGLPDEHRRRGLHRMQSFRLRRKHPICEASLKLLVQRYGHRQLGQLIRCSLPQIWMMRRILRRDLPFKGDPFFLFFKKVVLIAKLLLEALAHGTVAVNLGPSGMELELHAEGPRLGLVRPLARPEPLNQFGHSHESTTKIERKRAIGSLGGDQADAAQVR